MFWAVIHNPRLGTSVSPQNALLAKLAQFLCQIPFPSEEKRAYFSQTNAKIARSHHLYTKFTLCSSLCSSLFFLPNITEPFGRDEGTKPHDLNGNMYILNPIVESSEQPAELFKAL